ncbi:amidohydrolase family protein [Thermoflexus sp.]|uniref:amidohydrolase family protein n=1 Tax=Thermoflexus sp. TaxID=1969742 RepID=UPI00299BFF32|nr:amidohydrolase family protein [Thermoflexus sp.]MDW8065212.1 amidohydrolase family protein [Anaerolineae bacterium]
MVIDVHAHILVRELTREAAPAETWRPTVFRESGRERIEINGKPLTSVVRPFIDIEAIIEAQAVAGIQLTVLSPWVALLRDEEGPEEALRIASLLNEAMARQIERYPDRLRGLGVVPLVDPKRAARELEHWMQIPGIVGVEVPALVKGKPLGQDEFEPFWEAAEAMDALVFIHPTTRGIALQGLQDYYLWNAVGNPLETTVTAAHLVMAGALERHPHLKIVLAHGGGAVLSLKGRLCRAWEQRPEARQRLREPPEVSLRRFYFDTVTHDPEMLRALIAFAGADHVLLGSDYPFDMGLEEPVLFIRRLNLPPEKEQAILGGNMARLVGLEG